LRLLPVAIASALALVGVAEAHAKPLRLAAISTTAGPCRPLDGAAPAGEKAYYNHLAKRLGVEVLKCPVADAAAAATGLATGTLDMAVLGPAAYERVRSTARSILTLRAADSVNRIPVVLAVRANDHRRSLAELSGTSVAYGGASPAALATPRQVFSERGAGAGFFGREVVESEPENAVAQLRARQVDAMALHAADWQRLCRAISPKKPTPCADLAVVLKARPRAAQAIVVRRDMLPEMRYRLIGIHMPLHLEAPAAFAWAASWMPHAAEFVPTEAEALTLANLDR